MVLSTLYEPGPSLKERPPIVPLFGPSAILSYKTQISRHGTHMESDGGLALTLEMASDPHIQ